MFTFHLISVWGIHLPSFATTFGFPCSFSSCFNKPSSAMVHRYITQVNPDRHSELTDFWFLAFTWRHFDVFDGILWEKTDSQRPRTRSNNCNLYGLMLFRGGYNDFGGWDQTSQDLKARNFRWNPADHTIASKDKKPASPADVTRALDPDLLSRSREPEYHNFKRS